MSEQPSFSIHPSATPIEAAAVVAAIEQFVRETTPVCDSEATSVDRWILAARHEAVNREPSQPTTWGEQQHWA